MNQSSESGAQEEERDPRGHASTGSLGRPAIAVRRADSAPPSLLARRRAPAGSVPGTLAIPADAPPVEIRVIRYSATSIEELPLPHAASVSEQIDPELVTWLDVTGFGDGVALSKLGEELGIHPLAIADIVHTPQRSKFERFDDRHVIVLHMGLLKEGASESEDVEGLVHVDFEQVTLVLGPSWVVTFQERPGDDVFEPVRERLRQNLGALRRDRADRLAYALVDALVDAYFPILESVGENLVDLEELALAATGSVQIHDIHRMRRVLIHLNRILWGHRQTVSSMLRDEDSPFEPGVRVYLRDTYDHAIHQLDLVETLRELAAAIIEIHLSSISNRMNEVMKTLTVIASLFIPLTFLTGVYGMNFQYMPELEQRWAYPLFWVVIVVIGLSLLHWFRRRGWLRSD